MHKNGLGNLVSRIGLIVLFECEMFNAILFRHATFSIQNLALNIRTKRK